MTSRRRRGNIRSLYRVCLVAFWLVASGALQATPAAEWLLDSGDWRFSHLGVEEGLVTRVLQVVQDKDGFIWFGMQAGVARYDGRRIRRLTHDPTDPSSLSDSYVRSLHVDRSGRLWVGTDSGTLNLWEPATESFTRYSIGTGESMVGMGELSRDHFVVSTVSDLYGFDAASGTFTMLEPEVGTSAVLRSSSGLWAAHQQGLDLIVDSVDGPSIERRIPWPDHAKERDDGSDLIEGEDGVLWIVGGRGRISRFDPVVGRLETELWPEIVPETSYLISGLVDERGRLWVGTAGGLYVIETDTGNYDLIRADPWERRGLANNLIFDIFQDRTGQIWLTTDSGAERFDPLREDFAFFAHHPVGPEGPSGPPPGSIGSFAVDAEGGLWIGSLGSGLARMDPDGGVRYGASAEEDGPSGHIWAVLIDAQNRLWVGNESGVSRLDLDGPKGARVEFRGPEADWRRYESDPDDPFGLPAPRVVTLFEDAAGVLWVGSDGGLSAYDPIHDRFDNLDISSDRVLALAEDHEGRLWVGFDGEGIMVLGARDAAGQRPLLRHYKPASKGGEGADFISHGVISGIAVEPESLGAGVWATTLGGGLLRFGPDGALRTLRTADGLPSDSLKTLQIDAHGYVWTAADAETLRFDPQSGDLRRFNVADGVPRVVHTKASIQHGGQIFFGGIDGFTTFSPERIAFDHEPPTVVLTDFFIGEESKKPASIEPGSPLSESITSVDAVVLTHQLNEFTIEMAALHFGDPNRNRFSYMLEGADSDWIEVDSDRGFARYTRIPAGRHVLRVRAANRDGVWSEEELRLAIRILPPPWRSWWAQLFYALALAGVVAWTVRRRLRGLQEERDRQATELLTLRGLLPICASCKRIRDDDGEWEPLETYLDQHSEAKLSHGICPHCASDFFDS